MTGGFEVDPGVLDGIASTLRHASADVDDAGNSMPDPPDAGLGTPAITGILARLVDNAGQLVVGAMAAGDEVTMAEQNYLEMDAQARKDLHRAAGGVEYADRHQDRR